MMEGGVHRSSFESLKQLGETSVDDAGINHNISMMVIDIPNDHVKQDEKEPHHDEHEDDDDAVTDERSSEVSSLDFSAPEDDLVYGTYPSSSSRRISDDVIEHHLSRSAMMSAYRRRALDSRFSRYASSSYSYNSHHHSSYNPSSAHRVPWSSSGGLSPALEAVPVAAAPGEVPELKLDSDEASGAALKEESSPCNSEEFTRTIDHCHSHKEEKEEGEFQSPPQCLKEQEDLAIPDGQFYDEGLEREPERSSPLPSREDDDEAECSVEQYDSNSLEDADEDYSVGEEESSQENDSSEDDDKDDDKAEADDNGDDNDVPYQHEASEDSKYENYSLLVDPNQGDRAVEIELYSFARPHMRVFHLAWLSFFVAFFTWFAITPLLSEVGRSLSLTKKEIWTSSTLAVSGSAVTRVLIGPINDKYGARWAMCGTLVISAIPSALLGLVQSGIGLNVLRLVIGVAGSAFVTSQYWTSSFFTWEVAGTANALVAGWGNLGGGVTQIVMGTLLFPLFKIFYGGSFGVAEELEDDDVNNDEEVDRASDLAWRTVCIIPAVMCFVMAIVVVRRSDDSPKGNYGKRRREGLQPSVSARRALGRGLGNLNTWVLLIQYGCCFGVEITMVNAAALYFSEEFGQSTESAAAIASIFGWMNLFARGVGGFASDMSNAKWGMRGRLVVQMVTLWLEGVTVIGFSETDTLGGAIAVMVVFSVFVQAAEGSTFGIVPYVNPFVTGAIAGVVGAGGNVGGVGFSLLFREHAYRQAFKSMGYVAMGSALLTPLIRIPGHRSLLRGTDAPAVLDRRASHQQQMGNTPSVSYQLEDGSKNRSSRTTSQLRIPRASDDSIKGLDNV